MARRKRSNRRLGSLIASDIPFAKDDANRFLPWIVAFMVCLTGLMLAASLSLNSAVYRWNGNYVNSFTVQIPVVSATKRVSADRVVKLLKDNDWVKTARQITDSEMKDLVEPWLGKGHALDQLPLPMLIEVTVREGETVNLDALEKRLQRIAPGAEIDDYQLWMDKFNNFSAMIKWTAFVLAVLIVVTTLAIVIFAAKTALRLHDQTVDVLYTIGAQDIYIARQFQRNAMWLVLKGASIGAGVAGVLFWASHQLTSALQSPLLPDFDVSVQHIVLLVSLPLLTAMAAMVSTRMAVLALLKQKP